MLQKDYQIVEMRRLSGKGKRIWVSKARKIKKKSLVVKRDKFRGAVRDECLDLFLSLRPWPFLEASVVQSTWTSVFAGRSFVSR